MLLRELINKGTDAISQSYPEREAREMVFLFLEHHIGTKRYTHIMEPAYEVADSQVETAMSAFSRIAQGEPLQYVMGSAYFYGREYNVTPDVLIPRPETEQLCQMVISNTSCPSSILDLCTGSGCIAWTLALEMPGTEVTAVDISEGALAVAGAQDFADEMLHTGALAPTFVMADVLSKEALQGFETKLDAGQKKFDIVVSNPPYVMMSEKSLMRENVLSYEPHLALFVPDEDPLIFYRAVASWAASCLSHAGLLVVEINEALGLQTAEIFATAGFKDVSVVKDIHSRDRFVTARKL